VILAQEYSSGRFDMLYIYSKLLGIPLMTYHAGSKAEDYSGKIIRRYTLKRAAWIFTSGTRELDRLHREYEVPLSRMNIIRPPIDMNIYRPMQRDNACSAAGLKSSRRYWIFVGRLDDAIKRVSAIIRCFCEIAPAHPELDLLIVGTGNDGEKLKESVPEHFRERVRFLGWVTDEHKKAVLYNCSECLVMASMREGFPTVIGEAFACGIPVVCSDVGTIADLVIPGKTGWLFPAGDDAAMLAIYKTISDNPEHLEALRPNLYAAAEHHVSFRATAQALGEGFKKVMAKEK
jgi:glycosyltransferase involved in cell wall biosynthesis